MWKVPWQLYDDMKYDMPFWLTFAWNTTLFFVFASCFVAIEEFLSPSWVMSITSWAYNDIILQCKSSAQCSFFLHTHMYVMLCYVTNQGYLICDLNFIRTINVYFCAQTVNSSLIRNTIFHSGSIGQIWPAAIKSV